MIRTAQPDDRDRLRDLQSHLREPNPPLLEYAVEGPPLVLVSTARRETPRTGSGEERPATDDATDDLAGYLVAFRNEEAGYVAELVVAPDYRREGRARRLLAVAFDRLRDEGCSRVRLAVHPEDEPAQRLYDSMGFEEVGREENFYADGSESRVLNRDL